jgi:hypothetical protein
VVIIAMMAAMAAVVLPKVQRQRELQVFGVDKLPPSPPPVQHSATEEMWEGNSRGGRFLVGWHRALVEHSTAEKAEEESPFAIDTSRPHTANRNYEMGYIEIGDP